MISGTDLQFLMEHLDFWPHLKPDEQAWLQENTTPVTYPAGANIHRAEQDCIGVILVKTGALRTYMLSEEGKEITLYRLYAGDVCILSASCILHNITFDVYMDAETNCEILLINAPAFAHLQNANLQVENFALKIAADRFSDVMWAMQEILFRRFDARLAEFLLTETARNGTDEIKLTHEQIAKYLGSAREVVSRMLKYFEGEGMVRLSRGGLAVLDKQKLQTVM